MSGRFEELCDAWANGTLDDSGFAELQDELRASEEKRTRFVRVANLDSALRDLAADNDIASWDETMVGGRAIGFPRSNRSSRIVAWTAVAACVVLSLLLLSRFGAGPGDEAEAMGQGHAVLTRAVSPEWESEAHEPGDVLPEGTLEIASGLVQIEFFGGATVVLEGPAELEIRSATEAFCRSGKLRASVPPVARGFVVDTPTGRLVDLGTEFGLSVGEGTEPAVHVFDGKVEWHEDGEVEEILGGESVIGGKRSAAATADFAGPDDLDTGEARSRQSRFDRWKDHMLSLSDDSRLLVYYLMLGDGDRSRRLVNAGPTGRETDAAIVGANRVDGRWAGTGKSALEFTPVGSRARVLIPGEYGSVTLMCWVRVDSLDRQYNALYLTDNYQPGEVHWQIGEDGRILFSILVEPGKNLMSWSPPVWDLSDSGRWMHLAVVFDADAQEIRHFRNGKLILADPVPAEKEVRTTRFGPGEIGNWGLPNKPENEWFAIRNLNGRIDEFAIFADALPADEIASHHEIGNPR